MHQAAPPCRGRSQHLSSLHSYAPSREVENLVPLGTGYILHRMARSDQARGAQRRSAGRRAEYVALLAEVLLEAGRTDLVLRELAASVDTSHRVLLYYFTSRDDLEVAVLRHLADAEREALIALSGSGRSDTLRRVWGYLAEPRQL